jgi:hypothetical protein
MAAAVEDIVSPAQASRVAREVSEQVGERVDPPQIQAMARVARTHDVDVLAFVERFLIAAEAKAGRRGALVAGLSQAMEVVTRAPAHDPLAGVDAVLPTGQASSAVAVAEAQATDARRLLLRESVPADEAVRLTRRSRQSLERLRRAGRVLALREGNQWRYPRWQFDPDAPGGIIPGLDGVLAELRLSPAGAAYWLSRRHERLQAPPIQLLRSGRGEAVFQAAREQGERV